MAIKGGKRMKKGGEEIERENAAKLQPDLFFLTSCETHQKPFINLNYTVFP